MNIAPPFCSTRFFDYPTNIASVDLVIGCPKSRAGVTIMKNKNCPWCNWSNPNFDLITNYHYIVV